MIVAFWCVLIAAVLPICCTYVAKFGPRDGGEPPTRFDNHEPRAWLAAQKGVRARANAAQANSFEAFPFFAAGVVVAVLQHVPVATIDTIAVVFIVARIAYIACYLMDRPMLRSPVWAIGFGSCVALFLVAATGTLH
jgi:uncharacterized MAPEG superfamily protein